jgi:hypothetical protein
MHESHVPCRTSVAITRNNFILILEERLQYMASKNKVQPTGPAVEKYQETTTPTPQPALVEKAKRPIDPRISNGPISERECTDILCFLLYLTSFAVMWWIAITGYVHGKP